MNNIKKVVAGSIGDGRINYGFVSSTDKGLDPSEFVVTARTKGVFSAADSISFNDDDCLALAEDAKRVLSFPVSNDLKPFVLASRFYVAVSGVLGDESVLFSRKDYSAEADVSDLINRAMALGPQISTLAIYMTTVLFYNTNHNTGGNTLPRAFSKVLRSTLSLDPVITDQEITRATYLAGHAADKRIALAPFAGLDSVLTKVKTRGHVVRVTFDSWAAIRSSLHPAGTHSLGTLQVVLTKICSLGLGGFRPVPEAISALSIAMTQYLSAPYTFHPGASYLFGTSPSTIANVEEVKAWIGFFGGFCSEMGICRSVYSSPHYKRLCDDLADGVWTGIGRGLSKSVTVSVDGASAAMATMGLASGNSIPDPLVDAQGYTIAAGNLTATVEDLGRQWALKPVAVQALSPVASASPSPIMSPIVTKLYTPATVKGEEEGDDKEQDKDEHDGGI